VRHAYPIDNDDVRDRYLSDPLFKAIADHMCGMLLRGDIDIGSAMKAAVLGCQIYLENHGAPMIVVLGDERGGA
jgi:hypothetical protein